MKDNIFGCLFLFIILVFLSKYIWWVIFFIAIIIIVIMMIPQKHKSTNRDMQREHSQKQSHVESIGNSRENILTEEDSNKLIEKRVRIMPEEWKKYTKVRRKENDYTVLDFETTGLNADEHEIIEVAAIKFRDDKEVDRLHSYVKPIKSSIPFHITEITGITDKTVEQSPTIDMLIQQIVEFLSKENIVAHNASFDIKFLFYNMYIHHIPYQKFRVIDTLGLSRKSFPMLKNHKLETIKKDLEIDLKSHSAIDDCIVTAALYQKIKEIS